MKKKVVVGLVLFVGLLCIVYYFLFLRATMQLGGRCKGSARCFEGIVEHVIDGDTLEISGETVRLVLVNTPEKRAGNYSAATDYFLIIFPSFP